MSGLVPGAVLDRRSDLSCPQDNGTVWSANGYSWDILCNYDFPGNDLPAAPASSFTECLNACNNYKQNEQYLSGASCVAVVYGASNPNGNPCYLKASIDTVGTGNYMQYVARRTQYSVGQARIYTSIEPSASATSPPAAQASTSTPRVLSSAAISISTAIANTQDAQPATSSTTDPPLASGSDTTLSTLSPSGSPPPPATVTVTKDGTTQIITTAAATASPAFSPSTSSNTQTNAPPAAATTTSTPLSTPTQTSSPSTISSSSSSSNGLSDGAKIGLGVGLAVLAIIILSLATYIILSRRRRRRRHLQNTRIEQDTSSELPSTSASRSAILTPSAAQKHGDKTHLVSEVQEMSSPHPAAAELGSEKVHELSGGNERV